MAVYIDIGHGGTDPGTTDGPQCERDALRRVLTPVVISHLQQLNGVLFVPEIMPLSARVQWIRESIEPRSDVLISYHLNGGSSTRPGIEIFHAATAPPPAIESAHQLAMYHAVYLGRPVRRVVPDTESRPGRLAICRDAGTQFAYIIECGFLGHPEDYDAWVARGPLAVPMALAAYGVGR